MTFLDTLNQSPFLLYDGPMETRIEYGTKINLKNPATIFILIYQEAGQQALRNLYKTDIEVVQDYKAPIILNAPTWRASWAHIEVMGYKDKRSVTVINQDCIQFVKDIKKQFTGNKIFISAPIGPEMTDYQPDLAITIDESVRYHSLQANAVAQAGVDVISIASMFGSAETIGCAKAVAETGVPYSVGVVLNKDGTLLDGTYFRDLIHDIDQKVSPAPNFYVISCTHPTNAALALQDNAPDYKRILGIKANGSSKPVTELLAAGRPLADDPDIFADELIALGQRYHFKIYGGCCGTDYRHLEALAKKLSALYAI